MTGISATELNGEDIVVRTSAQNSTRLSNEHPIVMDELLGRRTNIQTGELLRW